MKRALERIHVKCGGISGVSALICSLPKLNHRNAQELTALANSTNFSMLGKIIMMLLMTVLISGCSETDVTPSQQKSTPAESDIDPGPAPPGQTEPEADPGPGIDLPMPAPSESTSTRSERKTLSANTLYYLGGPQQASPPDGELPAGTKVLVIQEAGSYQLVQAPDGRQLYVASSSLE